MPSSCVISQSRPVQPDYHPGRLAEHNSYLGTSLPVEAVEAVMSGDAMGLVELHENGCDMLATHSVHGASLLHIAATSSLVHEEERAGVIDVLLEVGIHVNSRAANGSTPLHWAAGQNVADAVEYLLSKGADPAIRSFTWGRNVSGHGSGQTPHHWAAESGAADALEVLARWDHGGVIMVDERGKKPRDLAEFQGHFDTAASLLQLEEQDFVVARVEVVGTAGQLVQEEPDGEVDGGLSIP